MATGTFYGISPTIIKRIQRGSVTVNNSSVTVTLITSC